MKLVSTPAPRPKTKSSGRWHGALEGMHRGMLYGWALDAERPDARVTLEVCLNGDIVDSVSADVARSDLAATFANVVGNVAHDVCHGFVADMSAYPNKDGATMTVRIANSETVLSGAAEGAHPDKPPVSATSFVFGDGGLRLHGWALDSAEEQRALHVRAFIGHHQIAQTVASQPHPNLRSHDVGAHGFTLDLPVALADGRSHSVRVIDEQGNALNGSPISVCCFASGVKTLLPASADGLLTDLIDAYESRLPRSLSMQHYPQWQAQFETAPADASSSPVRVGLIICGEGGAAELARTTASLKAQTDVALELFTPRAKGGKTRSFATLLQLALDAGCDILACVRIGDTLPAHALWRALDGFALPGAELVYTDSERNGTPWFKPAWNPDYALASDYPLELMLARGSLVRAIAASDGALPLDQASLSWRLLSALWPQGAHAIVHVPHVLYQFHSAPSAAEMTARTTAAQQALQAVEPAAVLEPLATAPADAGFAARRVRRPLTKRERNKTVSLIIPTRDRHELLERCIRTIGAHTDWPGLEIIVIDNGSTEAATKRYLRAIAKQGIKVLPLPGPFNFASLNNAAVAAASGQIIGLINNDIEALHDGWLDEMVSQLLRPGVGAVGAKLLWPNGMVQHGGVLLGVGNVAGHFGNRLADADWGDHGRNQLLQQVSGVTAACLLLRKRDYLALGGMDPLAFPVAFNDVDLCLKIRRSGKTIVWTPHARLLHAESASRGHEDTPQKRARAQREVDLLRQRWGAVLLRDPAYHPSLNLDPHSHAFGGLALPPRPRTPRLAALAAASE
jgi:GT2 family glycosyltransferase